MSKPGPKTKPTALKVLEGNRGKRKLKTDEPQADDLDPKKAPRGISTKARKYWKQAAEALTKAGIANALDSDALHIYAENFAIWKEAIQKLNSGGWLVVSPNGYPMQSPYFAIKNKAEERLIRIMTEFGMTASSRTRFAKEDDNNNKEDDFDKFLKERQKRRQKNEA